MRGHHSLAIDRAVLRWTRAKLRWSEVALATPGSLEWAGIEPEIGDRRKDLMDAEVALLRVGNRLLLTTGGGGVR